MQNPVRERRPKKEGPSRVVHPPAPLADHERWVFGYGSNMDLVDLERWLREQGFPSMPPDEVRVGTLPGHRIVWDYYAFSRRGGAANCAPADGDLPGLLVRVSEPLLAALDLKEGETYFRAVHDVHTEQGAVRAWVYRVHDHYREPDPVPPRRFYLDIVVRAARRYGLPDWHIDWLEQSPFLHDDD